MSLEMPRLIIDQSQCFKECGLKNFSDVTREGAELGQRRALEYMGEIAEQGNRMAHIELNRPVIAEIALEKAMKEVKDFNITFIPQSRPTFDVQVEVSSDWRPTTGRNIDINA